METLKNSWSDRHHKQFMIALHKIYQYDKNTDTAQFLEQIKIVEAYSLDKNRLFGLFSHVDFFLVYISKNVKTVSGYTQEEVYKKGLSFAFKAVYWKQLPMAIKVHKWGDLFRKALGKHVLTSHPIVFHVGLRLKNKAGEWRIFFIKQKQLNSNKKGHPILSFLDVEDITDIYKSDYCWARMTSHTAEGNINRAYFQNGKKKEYADILSAREIEILQLIIAKKDNVAISQILEISKNTVERHRKNMIARLGVTDMTALIHICRLCQFL